MKSYKILIVTDAWYPQVNGVVKTLSYLVKELKKQKHEVHLITPQEFLTLPCPTYPEIRLSINAYPKIYNKIKEINANIIHIATEGPLGFFARRYCIKNNIKFTTSLHTKFAEYINERIYIPVNIGYTFLRYFHKPSNKVLVTTKNMEKELINRNFKNLVVWTRGVNPNIFGKIKKAEIPKQAPIFIYVGRVAIEKNIEAFLDVDIQGSKVVVGAGPQLDELKRKYKDVLFTGMLEEKEVAAYLAASDVFVFPSKTDTFGIVIIEALAAGIPVAAYPVTGPLDILQNTKVDCLDLDLKTSMIKALKIKKKDCKDVAKQYTWENCAKIFMETAIVNLRF
jgi:glycosyltransferase involved in cell wall biosynthesis